MMTRKVCALAEITIGQVPPVLTPISATPHFKDFVLLEPVGDGHGGLLLLHSLGTVGRVDVAEAALVALPTPVCGI